MFLLLSVAVTLSPTLGCNSLPPGVSSSPGVFYKRVNFELPGVYIRTRWTGPPSGTAKADQQKVLGSNVNKIITEDIDRVVDAITAMYKLPQDMVSVKIDQNNALILGLVTIGADKSNCLAADFPQTTSRSTIFTFDSQGFVLSCSNEQYITAAGATPPSSARSPTSRDRFTITGTFISSLPASKQNWEVLAYQLQNDLIIRGYALFNEQDITLTYVSDGVEK